MEQISPGLSHVRRIVTRPAICEATRACGFADRELAALMRITSPTLSACMRGERPLPKFRQFALIVLVGGLLEGIGSPPTLPSTRHAERAQAIRRSVEHWLALAVTELGQLPKDVEAKGRKLGLQMLTELETRGAGAE